MNRPRPTRPARGRQQPRRPTAHQTAPPPAAEEPAGRRVDGSPILGPDQVYATPAGVVYHPAWCAIVADQWDNYPHRLLVTTRDAVTDRRQCRQCEHPLSP